MSKVAQEKLDFKWESYFNKDELNIFISTFSKLYESYINYYEHNPLDMLELKNINDYLISLRNKRLDEIPKDLKKMEKARLRRVILNDTKQYKPSEILSYKQSANEYLRFIKSINKNSNVLSSAIFEYYCYVKNNFNTCDEDEKALCEKCNDIRTKLYLKRIKKKKE